MTTEELKQDFDSARIKHVHFKTKLRSFLFGNKIVESSLRDPEQCGLGQWIANRLRGSGAYAHLPEARQLDRQHVLIHQQASQIMNKYTAGQREEANAQFLQVQVLADEMVELLQTMETKLRTQA